jgi:TfoX/Sxy family transcriptional regulator of competence genes
MTYDEKVAERLTKLFAEHKGVVEKKMFGGIAYMFREHMCVGVVDDLLMVRVGPEQYERALSDAHTRTMDFTGKPMKGYVYVEPAGFKTEKNLRKWVQKGINFVTTLPAKKNKRK